MLYDAYFLRNLEFSKKNGWLRFVAPNNKTIFFRKVPISLKVSVVEYRDQLFRIPRIILHQKHPLLTSKKIFFVFLSLKGHSCYFRHNDHGILGPATVTNEGVSLKT